MSKPVILIGGTAGSGKTTLAAALSCELQIDHRLGTGFVREIVKSQLSATKAPELYRYTFQAVNPVQNLLSQAKRLYGAVAACIARARGEGTSLIVEGNHLIPELYRDADVDLFVMLSAPPRDQHWQRLHGSSHTQRALSASDFENARLIDEYLWAEAAARGVSCLLYADNRADFIQLIREKSRPKGQGGEPSGRGR